MKQMRILIYLTISCLSFVSCNRLGYEVTRVESGTQGMVVTAHPLASAVGEQVLRDGGNATDAAIAVQFALAVVCPRAGNLGGGGFWLHAPVDDQVRALDYREEAPGAAKRDMYLESTGEVHPTKSLEGALAAGIPGTVDGLWTAYTFGSKLKNWSALLAPAIKLAADGYRITATEAERLNSYQEDFKRQNDFDFPFVKDEPWQRGDMLVQPQLAHTLRQLSSEKAGYFYDGDFANSLAEELRQRGGIWQAEDLQNYQSVWREPIAVDFNGLTIYSMPPPSSGGVVLAQMLGMLRKYDLQAVAITDSVDYYHLLIEVMRRAYEDRAEYLGDPDMVQIPLERLLDSSYLASKWADYDPQRATVSDPSKKAGLRDVYETTHTSIIDRFGNAVAVTTTLNGNFGSKVWSRVGGFFLNNEMDDFSAKPGVPNQFGLVGGEANAIAPGKRMLSSMTPTVVQQEGINKLVLGSPGGSTIITAVLQVLLNAVVHDMDIAEAVAAPRVHHQWLPDEVLYERGRMSERVLEGLRERGHTLRAVTNIGRVKAVENTSTGLTGAGDARNPDDDASGW